MNGDEFFCMHKKSWLHYKWRNVPKQSGHVGEYLLIWLPSSVVSQNISVAVMYCLFSKVKGADPFLLIDPKAGNAKIGHMTWALKPKWKPIEFGWNDGGSACVNGSPFLRISCKNELNTSCTWGCYLKQNKHNKQMQPLLLRKQTERLRQMSNDLLKLSIPIDFLHWRKGTFSSPSGSGALCSSHTHFSFLMRTALFWAAKIHQRLHDLWKMSHTCQRN